MHGRWPLHDAACVCKAMRRFSGYEHWNGDEVEIFKKIRAAAAEHGVDATAWIASIRRWQCNRVGSSSETGLLFAALVGGALDAEVVVENHRRGVPRVYVAILDDPDDPDVEHNVKECVGSAVAMGVDYRIVRGPVVLSNGRAVIVRQASRDHLADLLAKCERELISIEEREGRRDLGLLAATEADREHWSTWAARINAEFARRDDGASRQRMLDMALRGGAQRLAARADWMTGHFHKPREVK